MGVRGMTIQQSLQHVVNNPELESDDLLQVPASELVCRVLFDIANSAQLKDRKSMARANTARGGGIFLHASSSRSTAGCVAVDYWETRRIIRWLDAGKKPRIVMAPTSWLSNA